MEENKLENYEALAMLFSLFTLVTYAALCTEYPRYAEDSILRFIVKLWGAIPVMFIAVYCWCNFFKWAIG